MMDVRQAMPDTGWTPAPCERYTEDHPAHGWQGPKSGRIYWCGPDVCESARLVVVAGKADRA